MAKKNNILSSFDYYGNISLEDLHKDLLDLKERVKYLESKLLPDEFEE